MSRIAYFDCPSGISGDMTLGALLDAGAERAVLDAAVEALGLAGEVRVETRHEERGHLGGVRVDVVCADGPARNLPELERVVRAGRGRHREGRRQNEDCESRSKAKAHCPLLLCYLRPYSVKDGTIRGRLP